MSSPQSSDTEVVIESPNARDLPLVELRELEEHAREIGSGLGVRVVARPVHRDALAVTLWEVIVVYAPSAFAWLEFVRRFITWARGRFRKSPGRPKSLTIFGPGGNPLISIVVHSPESEVEDITAKCDERRLPPPREGGDA